MSFYTEYWDLMNARIREVDEAHLDQICDWMRTSVAAGGKVIVVGNGGSAAMASHTTVDLTKNAGIRAINFNEADLLTCFANDYGYENWVSEALGFYADKQDTLVLISSSGKSPNILNGADKGKAMGLKVATLSGFAEDNPLRSKGDINLYCASGAYNIVEMTHHIWLLAIVDRLIGKI